MRAAVDYIHGKTRPPGPNGRACDSVQPRTAQRRPSWRIRDCFDLFDLRAVCPG